MDNRKMYDTIERVLHTVIKDLCVAPGDCQINNVYSQLKSLST